MWSENFSSYYIMNLFKFKRFLRTHFTIFREELEAIIITLTFNLSDKYLQESGGDNGVKILSFSTLKQVS